VFRGKQKVTVLEAPTTTDIEKGIATTINSEHEQRRDQPKLEHRKSNLVLPSNTTSDELDVSRSCSICLCEYEHGDGICYSRNDQCVHRFHTNCAVAWFAKHEECPICRAQYLVELSNTITTLEGGTPVDDASTPLSSSEQPPPPPHHPHTTTATAAFELARGPIIVIEEEDEEGDIESNSSSMPELLAITEDEIRHTYHTAGPSAPLGTNEDDETSDDESSTVSSMSPSITICSSTATTDDEPEPGMPSHCDDGSTSSASSTLRRNDTTMKNTEEHMPPGNILIGPENV
jgi:Ring finger domain